MSEGLQDTAGESSKMSKGGATSEEPCKSGKGLRDYQGTTVD